MKTIKIAIVGAGFSGMASAYYLSKYLENGLNAAITILDPGEIGENASGIAAGLLHSFAGAHAKLANEGFEGMAATLELAKASGESVAAKTGMLRVAVTEEQAADFRITAEKYDGVRWLESEQCQKLCPGLVSKPGIFIEEAFVLNTKQYLLGLWQKCNDRGVRWEKRKIASLKELENYNAVIVAAGANITGLPELKDLPVRPVKGQVLQFLWPAKLPRLTVPVNSRAYLVQTDVCVAGATFERNFLSKDPDPAYALDYLKPKMTELFPDLEGVEITACHSGIRASTPNHLPLIGRKLERTWIITGMGSKGLLYHALYARKVVDDVVHTLVNSKISYGKRPNSKT